MVTPRFEIGQEVFTYRHGKPIPVSWDYGINEDEIFLSKEEFVNIV